MDSIPAEKKTMRLASTGWTLPKRLRSRVTPKRYAHLAITECLGQCRDGNATGARDLCLPLPYPSVRKARGLKKMSRRGRPLPETLRQRGSRRR